MIENSKIFQYSINEGLGFTEACHMTNNDPQEATKYLLSKDGKSDYEAILAAHRNARVKKLTQIADLKGSRSEIGKADELLDQVRKIPPLVLWESVCKKTGITSGIAIEAFLKIRYPVEVATGLGMRYEEWIEYVRNNELVASEVRRLGLTIALV